MVRLLVKVFFVLFALSLQTQLCFAVSDSFFPVTNTSSGRLGSPISGGNGKIYIADTANSRLIVVTASNNAVSTIALPGQPQSGGGALSISKDGTLMAIPLLSSKIVVMNLGTEALQEFDIGGGVPLSTAFGSSNSTIFFSTTNSFSYIYLFDTAQAAVTKFFGVSTNLAQTGIEMQLATNAAGDVLYALERFVSPGGLHKISVSNPLSPTFIAEDTHGSLGSNCRGLAVLPADIAPPSQGHEAYIACGHPYFVQAISHSGSLLFPATQFTTEHYPIGVDTLPNGDVVAVRDTSIGNGAFLFDSGGQFKSGWTNAGNSNASPTADGVAATLVNGVAKAYVTVCGINFSNSTNCEVLVAGGPADDGGGDEDEEDAAPEVTISLSKRKLSDKGGSIVATALISGGTASSVSAVLKKGSKVVKTFNLKTTLEPTVFRGNVSLPKNLTKKTVAYSLFARAVIDGEIVDSAPVSASVSGKKK